jgi:hypothetical protein
MKLLPYNHIIIMPWMPMWETMGFFYYTGMSDILRTALITVTCVLVVISVFTFIAGLICGYYISQRRRASTDINEQSESQNIPKDLELELELKKNAAYIHLHPST